MPATIPAHRFEPSTNPTNPTCAAEFYGGDSFLGNMCEKPQNHPIHGAQGGIVRPAPGDVPKAGLYPEVKLIEPPVKWKEALTDSAHHVLGGILHDGTVVVYATGPELLTLLEVSGDNLRGISPFFLARLAYAAGLKDGKGE